MEAMQIKFFCPRWGFEHIPWQQFLADVKAAGYAGIEWYPFGEETDYAEVLKWLQHYQLEFSIVMTVYNAPVDAEAYFIALEQQLLQLCGIRKKQLVPLFISAQTGREYFTAAQIERCLGICKQVHLQTQVPVYQETHRNKWSYAAHAVYPVLQQHKDLPLTFDVSHWFCVSESYLEDQQPAVELAIQHARHIHARVGHIEGPQVFDPALPEYTHALEQHLNIWDKWIAQRKQNGDAYCTITPEFGPPPYMVVGNRQEKQHELQWRINLWMKSFLEKRYKEVCGL